MRQTSLIAITLLCLAAALARADVKNVWVGVNGATCPT
jgi:hypothetical protein